MAWELAGELLKAHHAKMKKQSIANSQDRRDQVSVQKSTSIKLGLDVHADKIVVVRQMDGATPQPAQKFKPELFLQWASKQLDLGEEVWSCYEAGPLGYELHRKLEAMGIHNVVVRPRVLDEEGKGVKTDARDALGLVQNLDRYVQGNRQALSVVRVPTPEEEHQRSWGRLRDELRKERQRLEAKGRGMMLYYGFRASGPWWKARKWSEWSSRLPEFLIKLLEELRPLIETLDQKVREHTRKLELEAPADRPRGFGALSMTTLDREVCDWNRFANRRTVGSYTGLCPGEHSSGNRRHQGSINKHGNPRLRHVLIELAWRVVRFQPNYHALHRWKKVFRDGTGAARKKAIVAIARHLAIDLWRLKTGRAQSAQLGLEVMAS